MRSIEGTFLVEYRGRKPGGEFKNDDGDEVKYGARLQFEQTNVEGSADTFTVSGDQWDRCPGSWNYEDLKKGDMVSMSGVVGQSRESGLYVRPTRVTKVEDRPPASAGVAKGATSAAS